MSDKIQRRWIFSWRLNINRSSADLTEKPAKAPQQVSKSEDMDADHSRDTESGESSKAARSKDDGSVRPLSTHVEAPRDTSELDRRRASARSSNTQARAQEEESGSQDQRATASATTDPGTQENRLDAKGKRPAQSASEDNDVTHWTNASASKWREFRAKSKSIDRLAKDLEVSGGTSSDSSDKSTADSIGLPRGNWKVFRAKGKSSGPSAKAVGDTSGPSGTSSDQSTDNQPRQGGASRPEDQSSSRPDNNLTDHPRKQVGAEQEQSTKRPNISLVRLISKFSLENKNQDKDGAICPEQSDTGSKGKEEDKGATTLPEQLDADSTNNEVVKAAIIDALVKGGMIDAETMTDAMRPDTPNPRLFSRTERLCSDGIDTKTDKTNASRPTPSSSTKTASGDQQVDTKSTDNGAVKAVEPSPSSATDRVSIAEQVQANPADDDTLYDTTPTGLGLPTGSTGFSWADQVEEEIMARAAVVDADASRSGSSSRNETSSTEQEDPGTTTNDPVEADAETANPRPSTSSDREASPASQADPGTTTTNDTVEAAAETANLCPSSSNGREASPASQADPETTTNDPVEADSETANPRPSTSSDREASPASQTDAGTTNREAIDANKTEKFPSFFTAENPTGRMPRLATKKPKRRIRSLAEIYAYGEGEWWKSSLAPVSEDEQEPGTGRRWKGKGVDRGPRVEVDVEACRPQRGVWEGKVGRRVRRRRNLVQGIHTVEGLLDEVERQRAPVAVPVQRRRYSLPPSPSGDEELCERALGEPVTAGKEPKEYGIRLELTSPRVPSKGDRNKTVESLLDELEYRPTLVAVPVQWRRNSLDTALDGIDCQWIGGQWRAVEMDAEQDYEILPGTSSNLSEIDFEYLLDEILDYAKANYEDPEPESSAEGAWSAYRNLEWVKKALIKVADHYEDGEAYWAVIDNLAFTFQKLGFGEEIGAALQDAATGVARKKGLLMQQLYGFHF